MISVFLGVLSCQMNIVDILIDFSNAPC